MKMKKTKINNNKICKSLYIYIIHNINVYHKSAIYRL